MFIVQSVVSLRFVMWRMRILRSVSFVRLMGGRGRMSRIVLKKFLISILKKAAAKSGNKVDDLLVAQLEKALFE